MSVHARLALVAGCGLLAVGLAACGTTASTASQNTTGLGAVHCPNGVNGSCDDGKKFTSAPPTSKPAPKPRPAVTHTIDFTVKDAVSGSCVFPKAAAVRLADEHGTILASTSLGAPVEFLKGACYYAGTFGLVSPKPLQYVLTTDAFQGTSTMSHGELAANGWILPVTIYSNPNG